MKDGYTIDQAMAEAGRCLLCHEPPCSGGCPASTDPGRFIRQIRLRNLKGAAATVKRNNVLGGVCGVLCPTCNLCQQGCTAAGMDRPIEIGKLQRFAVEHAWDIGFQPLSHAAPNGVRIAVVGGGPSGLTCAAELALAGFGVTVFEKLDRVGGILQHVLPDHRMSREFLDREIAEIAALGVEFVCGRAAETRADLEALFAEGYAGIYMATGAWEPVRLDIPGKGAGGVWDGISFLRKARESVGELDLAGKEVAVIGGGDTAMDVAVSAVRAGARDVYVVYRRSLQQMPGDETEKLDALAAGVHFVILTHPLEYLVEGGKVVGLRVQRDRLGEPDASGRRSPVPLPGSEHVIGADVVVEAVGLRPPKELARLELTRLDDRGRILVTPQTGATTAANIYAGGDAARGAALVADAVADGKRAAQAMVQALDGEVGR